MERVVLQYKYCIASWKGHEAGEGGGGQEGRAGRLAQASGLCAPGRAAGPTGVHLVHLACFSTQYYF